MSLMVLLLIAIVALNCYGEAGPTSHIHAEVPNLRIVGGREATPHSVPFMVYLQPILPNNTESTCAGSILSKNYFLTAAHCMYRKNGWVALFGGHDVTIANDPLTTIRNDGPWLIHPNYSRVTKEYDIAIVKIPSGIPFNEHIQPVKLPSRRDISNTYLGETVSAYGWGETAPKTLPKVLMTIDLKVSPLTDCVGVFNKPISDKQLCTFAGVGKGTCDGDSGAPIMHGNTQIGLLSFGDINCESSLPEVDTRIDQYLDWIEANSDVVIN